MDPIRVGAIRRLQSISEKYRLPRKTFKMGWMMQSNEELVSMLKYWENYEETTPVPVLTEKFLRRSNNSKKSVEKSNKRYLDDRRPKIVEEIQKHIDKHGIKMKSHHWKMRSYDSLIKLADEFNIKIENAS